MKYLFTDLLAYYRELWYDTCPTNPRQETYYDHKYKDKALVQLKKDCIHLLKKHHKAKQVLNDNDKTLIKEKVLTFMTKTLELSPWACQILDDEGYYEITTAFIDKAKQLCPTMNMEAITQALRNMWVIIALQIYMGEPVALTEPAFAYSMLYPLTDNYMDNPEITTDIKKSFNQRFHQKIKTGIAEPFNSEESCIFDMIDHITTTYDRSNYPEVIQSLLAILDGQNKSLDQHKLSSLYEIDLLGFTFYKGGTSVLADAYLVRGHLSEEEASLAFGYGVLLQIADDLEDIDEDLLHQHYTLANTQTYFGELDEFFNRYRQFIDQIFVLHFDETTDKQKALSELMQTSITYLLMSAVYSNKHHYSLTFIKEFQGQSRFSIRAQSKHNHRIAQLMAP